MLLINYTSSAQSSGYLGQHVQIEATFAPSLNIGFLSQVVSSQFPSSSSKSIENDEGVLLGGRNNGVTGINVFNGSEFSLSYVISRKATLGLSYGASRSYGLAVIREFDPFFGFTNESTHSVPCQVQSIQLKGDYFSAIAPLQRYYRVGIGLDFIRTDMPSADRAIRSNRKLGDYQKVLPFFALGIGGNYFIIDNLYLSLGLDLNISPSIFRIDQIDDISDSEMDFLPYRHLFTTRILQYQLGIGLSL